jgi:hypothetical protein
MAVPGSVAVRLGQIAIVATATAVLMALVATSASASLQRNHEASFGTFSAENPQALTVDQSNGDIYVIDTGSDTVSRFNSSGLPHNFSAGPNPGTNTLSGLNFENFSALAQVAVDNSGGPSDGNVYVTQSGSGQVKIFASDGEPLGSLNGSGTPSGSFGEVCGAAVDQSNGDLYLSSYGNRIWRYSPSGATVVEGDYSGGIETATNTCQLAVASGSLYAQDWKENPPPVGFGAVHKYETSAFATGTPPAASSTSVVGKAGSIATDPSNGDLYVDEGNKVSVFSSTGNPKYSFGAGDFGSESAGVGVKANGNAYVSDPVSHQVDVYGPFSAPPPIVETMAATGVKHTRATLHGHLDPNESLAITGCVFEWGTDTSYAETPISCAEGSSFSAAADVSAELTGLVPGTVYHFRLHVTTGSGGFDGEDASFETTPASSVPEVVTGTGSIVSSTSSQLRGTVNPNANPLTDCHFEYVTDLAIQATGFSDLSSGGSVPCDQAPGSIGADFEDHEVTATITGLDPEQVYRFRLVAENANGPGNGSDALVPGPPLVETVGSPSRTTTTARFDSRVSPHGAETNYWFEYVTDAQFRADGFAQAISTPSQPLVGDEVQDVIVEGSGDDAAHLSGQFSLSFGGYTTPELSVSSTAEEMQAALVALPSIGASDVQVDFRQNGEYSVTFQGALGNTNVEQLGVSKGTDLLAAKVETRLDGGGRTDRTALVAAYVQGLQPATTYRYRVVADNGTPGGPSSGEPMSLTTRASDAPLSHGHFPGPPGSDRAWEQVNAPDLSGNRVENAPAISDDGNRAVYSVYGGTPDSDTGASSRLFAERTASGWQTSRLFPTRTQATGNNWAGIAGTSDLSRLFSMNYDTTRTGSASVWSLSPGLPAQRTAEIPDEAVPQNVFTITSDDGSRFVAYLENSLSLDPNHPITVPPGHTVGQTSQQLYDLSSGTPHLVSLLPDGSVPACGVINPISSQGPAYRSQHLLSADGSHLFFESVGSGGCGSLGTPKLYVRDLESETTTLIAPDPLFIRSTVDAAFFSTPDSLVPEDEGGDDVYRYGLEDQSFDCLTCFPGLSAEVNAGQGVAVADNGSRVYFLSPNRLLPGARPGLYRVDVASGDLAYVGSPPRGSDQPSKGNAISPDGSVFVFRAEDPTLNSVNGPQNGGGMQYYRYDDDDRSLVCVSCPSDGSRPRGQVDIELAGIYFGEAGPNITPLSANGDDLVFPTPTPLVSADQNTAGRGRQAGEGTDIYEWRDGRLLLVTDGLASSVTDSTGSATRPRVQGITPSGRDVFFTQAAQLTPDALDASYRLYDARIGGGFESPPPPPPCPLEACQGTPKGVPEESRPGSADYSGTGNVTKTPRRRCRKGKVHRKGRCVAKKHKHGVNKHPKRKADNDRRASR